MDLPKQQRILERANGSRFVAGNSVKILHNGDQIFPAMLDAIDRAENRIDFATYVYWQGEIAEVFAQRLADKARSGVQTRVLLDAVGAKQMKDPLIDQLLDAGVELRWFRPLSTWRLWRMGKRMHRKILLCDDRCAFTGGVGIGQEWTGDARNSREWRDTHVEIRGPVIEGIYAAFVQNWNESGSWTCEQEIDAPAPQSEDIPITVVRGSTTIGWTDTASLIRTLLCVAQKELQITTAYFNPDDKLRDLLISASQRGVSVKILVPGKQCDSRLSQLAGHSQVEKLLAHGVQIWQYQKTMLHAKYITIDGEFACIGSANFNHRSMLKDEECCIIAQSKEVAENLDRKFDNDLKDADQINHQSWAKRSRWLKAREWLAQNLENQL
tara:strand:- start:13876 stop:15024 length:1149 start_codon:yes stop_codon:yes gene_type:complete